MSADVAVIDNGGANIASIVYALDRLGARATLTSNEEAIRAAPRVILPGVGSASAAMSKLRDNGLVGVIPDLQQPVLGICLGMHLLANASEESDVSCLGIFSDSAKKLMAAKQYPVPNMGWCQLSGVSDHPLLNGIDDSDYFYFLHSYALPVSEYTLANAQHENPFSAIIGHNNYVAAQFHPERSSSAGSRFLKNFLDFNA